MSVFSTIRLHAAAFSLLCSLTCLAQDVAPFKPAGYTTTSGNYVRSWEVVRPVTDANTITTASPVTDARLTTQYLDGLGRPLQTVVKQGSLITDPNNLTASTTARDLVSPVVYDEFGREVRKYLPYATTVETSGSFKQNPFVDQASFYSGSTSPRCPGPPGHDPGWKAESPKSGSMALYRI